MFGHKRLPPPPAPRNRCAAARSDGLVCERFVAPGETHCYLHDRIAEDDLPPPSKQQIALSLLYLAKPAVRRLARLMESPDEIVALKAIQIYLDRIGVGPHLSVHASEQSEDLTDLTTEQLAARAAAVLARLQGGGDTAGAAGVQAAPPGPLGPAPGPVGTPATSQLNAPDVVEDTDA